jgi:hypothetical protein
MKPLQPSTRDLQLTLMFLRRVLARGPDEDVLVRLVARLEAEIKRRKHEC